MRNEFLSIYLIFPAALGLGFTQPLTEMSTRSRKLMFLGSKVWPVRRADNLTELTIPTERPPLISEVSANFCGWRMPRGQRDESLRPYSRISRPEPLLFLPSSSSVVLTRLSGPRSRPTASQKIWERRESQ
jgi:hypothetical protein